MSQITTHVLDTANGRTAFSILVTLYRLDKENWIQLASGTTDTDGRVTNLLPDGEFLSEGIYRLRFLTEIYFNIIKEQSLYPFVDITFHIRDRQHYHIPLLISPFGYTTYRGS
jgi:5-hydroxyisourate hydrolase